MKVFSNGNIVSADISSALRLGKVEDERVGVIESNVTAYYNVSVNEIKDWRNNNEAKKMLCFLLVNKLGYSIVSVADAYNIYKYYLQNEIIKIYKDALQNTEVMQQIDLLSNTNGVAKPSVEC